ncbi:unnamed protein product [Didymodactylos carnosus]|uniref:Uncharacterized protein n=1 Tax=Didymodactylos carnosus TaxID=1234261 RepID=A0A8S2Q2Z6_9BILA|nr:unnamed protein product [Didymodactylos carnosus]
MIAIITAAFVHLTFISGSHFNGGTITWHPTDFNDTSNPINITITQTYSWTYGKVNCTNAMITNHSYINYGTYTTIPTDTLTCISPCNTGSSGNARGYSSTHIIPQCTDTNPIMGTTIGQRTDTKLLYLNDNFTVAYQSASPYAWLPLAGAGSASALWSIATNIDLYLRPDGYYNSAPLATMMSPLNIPKNVQQIINIPVSDANDDDLRCRWANSSTECGDACPTASMIPANTVEDFISTTSTAAMSTVPVQFLVHVVDPTSCAVSPQVVGFPAESSCTPVQAGVPYNTIIIAIDNCPSVASIAEISTLSIPGMGKGNLTKFNSTTYYRNVTWIPDYSQIGPQILFRPQRQRPPRQLQLRPPRQLQLRPPPQQQLLKQLRQVPLQPLRLQLLARLRHQPLVQAHHLQKAHQPLVQARVPHHLQQVHQPLVQAHHLQQAHQPLVQARVPHQQPAPPPQHPLQQHRLRVLQLRRPLLLHPQHRQVQQARACLSDKCTSDVK